MIKVARYTKCEKYEMLQSRRAGKQVKIHLVQHPISYTVVANQLLSGNPQMRYEWLVYLSQSLKIFKDALPLGLEVPFDPHHG